MSTAATKMAVLPGAGAVRAPSGVATVATRYSATPVSTARPSPMSKKTHARPSRKPVSMSLPPHAHGPPRIRASVRRSRARSLVQDRDELASGLCPRTAERVLHMLVCRRLADVESDGDLAIRSSFRDERDDLSLPRCESARRRGARDREHAQHLEQCGQRGAGEGDLPARDGPDRARERVGCDLPRDKASEPDPCGGRRPSAAGYDRDRGHAAHKARGHRPEDGVVEIGSATGHEHHVVLAEKGRVDLFQGRYDRHHVECTLVESFIGLAENGVADDADARQYGPGLPHAHDPHPPRADDLESFEED